MKKVMCLLTCLACFSSSSFANESPQALQDAFMAALKANDVQGLADCYTGDAVNFPVGTLVGTRLLNLDIPIVQVFEPPGGQLTDFHRYYSA